MKNAFLLFLLLLAGIAQAEITVDSAELKQLSDYIHGREPIITYGVDSGWLAKFHHYPPLFMEKIDTEISETVRVALRQESSITYRLAKMPEGFENIDTAQARALYLGETAIYLKNGPYFFDSETFKEDPLAELFTYIFFSPREIWRYELKLSQGKIVLQGDRSKLERSIWQLPVYFFANMLILTALLITSPVRRLNFLRRVTGFMFVVAVSFAGALTFPVDTPPTFIARVFTGLALFWPVLMASLWYVIGAKRVKMPKDGLREAVV